MFKTKNKKSIIKDNRTTIDALHKEKEIYFENLQEKVLPQKKRELHKYQKKVIDYQNETKNLENILYKESEIRKINMTIEKLKDDINKIEKREEENKYYLNVSHILNDYYELKNNSQNYNVLDLLYEYVRATGNNNIVVKKKNQKEEFEFCPKCDVPLINSDYYLICNECGKATPWFLDTAPSYKEKQEYEYNQPYKYLKINHFDECLSQFQGKENSEIPNNVLDGLHKEIKKNRITDLKKLNHNIIYEFLKKLSFNNYYEHIPLIIKLLGGTAPPSISTQNEEKLRLMFYQILEPFEKYCPSDKRKNLISYQYILYKFFELLELDEFLDYFKLLKNRDKLYDHDQIWKNICKDLKWQYIPTRS
jgi:hypothetical protein